jgi:hypothetical protein
MNRLQQIPVLLHQTKEYYQNLQNLFFGLNPFCLEAIQYCNGVHDYCAHCLCDPRICNPNSAELGFFQQLRRERDVQKISETKRPILADLPHYQQQIIHLFGEQL